MLSPVTRNIREIKIKIGAIPAATYTGQITGIPNLSVEPIAVSLPHKRCLIRQIGFVCDRPVDIDMFVFDSPDVIPVGASMMYGMMMTAQLRNPMLCPFQTAAGAGHEVWAHQANVEIPVIAPDMEHNAAGAIPRSTHSIGVVLYNRDAMVGVADSYLTIKYELMS